MLENISPPLHCSCPFSYSLPLLTILIVRACTNPYPHGLKVKASMLLHKYQDFTQKVQSFIHSTHYILLFKSSKAKKKTVINMKRKKRESSDASAKAAYRISRYLLALVFIILAFTTPTLLSASTKDHVFPEFIKWHIYVVNGLSNNQNLFTHCKSTENDLGTQNLSPGSNITWSFRTEFFHSTLFWCYVSKDNASSSASFEVFWYDARLFNKCDWKNCIWVAKDDGVYLKDLSENLDELRYRWDDGM